MSAEWVDAADDGEAIAQVEGQSETYELWNRNRLVARNDRPRDESS
ncbi:MAG TPA: hypothetical protein VM145_07055 [Sphingomicrobium sp.]|nr:hypothetical protein [Sphingomicrobium sp.]